jgi:hypothetical protein
MRPHAFMFGDQARYFFPISHHRDTLLFLSSNLYYTYIR